jgi:carbamoyl-phosphate synthase large subunit
MDGNQKRGNDIKGIVMKVNYIRAQSKSHLRNFTTVLLTGVGAPGTVGTLFALKQGACECTNLRIIGTDLNEKAVGKFLVDKFYVVPHPFNDSEEYIRQIEHICEAECVDVILPQTINESIILPSIGTKDILDRLACPLNNCNDISSVNDKKILYDIASSLDIPMAKYKEFDNANDLVYTAKYLGYPDKPFVVKPPISNGGRGIRIVSENPLTDFLKDQPPVGECTLSFLLDTLQKCPQFPTLIAMEYLPGIEYTVDVWKGRQGSLVIPRRRDEVRSGISFDTTIITNKKMEKQCLDLANVLNLSYCFGFQFREDEDKVPKLVECNPRIQGTMVASLVGTNFNMIWACVLERLGEDVFVPVIKNKAGGRFVRYWGGIGVTEDGEFCFSI